MKLFIIDLKHPTRKIRERDLAIKVCPKTVWAIREDGRRYLLGSSAFQTPAAAARCQAALLQKFIADPYLQRHNPYGVQRAAELLKTLH